MVAQSNQLSLRTCQLIRILTTKGEMNMTDEVPKEVQRQRELFNGIRDEIRRLNPDRSPMNWETTEAEMLKNHFPVPSSRPLSSLTH